MVSVCLVTYNQSLFISEAIESVINQKTNFPINLVIGEDCSQDKTLDICLKYESAYPNQIEVIRNTRNIGLVANTLNVLKKIQASGTKYIAMLDGDDYWIDPFKVQKQVDFLESNPDFGLVHTSVDLLINKTMIKQSKKSIDGDVFSKMHKYPLANCTVLFNSYLLDLLDYNELLMQNFLSIDYVLSVIFSFHTKFKFFPESTAVWRRGHNSVSNTNSYEKDVRYIEHHVNVWRYLSSIFPKEIAFTVEDGQSYLIKQAFRLSFKHKNFIEAHRLVKEPTILNDSSSLVKKIRIFSAKSKTVFNIFNFTILLIKKFKLQECFR